MSDVKLTLIVEIDGHTLVFKEEGDCGPVGNLTRAAGRTGRLASDAVNRATQLISRMYPQRPTRVGLDGVPR